MSVCTWILPSGTFHALQTLRMRESSKCRNYWCRSFSTRGRRTWRQFCWECDVGRKVVIFVLVALWRSFHDDQPEMGRALCPVTPLCWINPLHLPINFSARHYQSVGVAGPLSTCLSKLIYRFNSHRNGKKRIPSRRMLCCAVGVWNSRINHMFLS